jgi:EpsI family protein
MSTADNPLLHDASTFSPSLAGEKATGKELWLYAGLGATALTLLSAPIFTALFDLWTTRDDYSHGFLVPLICLYLVRMKWEGIRCLPIKPALMAGMSIMLFSVAGLLAGVAGGVITLGSMSWIGLLIGLTLILFGYRFVQIMGFSFAYLVFMTPFLDVVVEPLQYPLQRLGAIIVSALFQGVGVPTYLDGTSIQFPNGILEVAVQCSGAGFLISALAIGLPLAVLVLHGWRYRAALIVLVLLVSLVANWMRIALIALIGYLSGWGPQVHGPLHILQGMLVYWVALGALFAGAWILARMERNGSSAGPKEPYGTVSSERAAVGRVLPWQAWRRAWWAALAMLAAAPVWLYGYDVGPVAAKRSIASLPLTIGQWQAGDTEQTTPIVKIAGADEEVARVYRRADGAEIRLYVAYLTSQAQGKELVNYLTAPLHHEAAEVALPLGGESMPVNVGVWTEQRMKTPILFWYAVSGRTISGRYEAKAASILQALMHQGSSGALVLIAGDANESREQAAVDMKHFAKYLIPVLRPYLP